MSRSGRMHLYSSHVQGQKLTMVTTTLPEVVSVILSSSVNTGSWHKEVVVPALKMPRVRSCCPIKERTHLTSQQRQHIQRIALTSPSMRRNSSSTPARVAIFAASFPATDYFWYRQQHKRIHSLIWTRVLGSSPLPPSPSQ
jgi:hypothetical protein